MIQNSSQRNKQFPETSKYNPTPFDNLTTYDKTSIMHYDGLLRSNVATPIITDRITGQSIGVNRKMSKIDV